MINLNTIGFWSRKYYRRARQLLGSHLYRNPDRNLQRSILVAGTARSGTTWLADLIASQVACRLMFEPFHPQFVGEYHGFHYFQYMRPGTDNEKFRLFAHKVFTGVIRNRWIDRQNEQIFPRVRLIKEIRANLALKWLHDHFPEVPIVFLIRHPCAVVSSRMELGWATDLDIEPFLSQPDLIKDHLVPYIDLISRSKAAEQKHAIIWCVSNLIPLNQLNPDEIKIVYYENLCLKPERELPAILEFTGQRYSKSVLNMIGRPSQTTRVASAIVRGTDRVEGWKKKLSRSQSDNILQVVHDFGLNHLYGDSSLPFDKSIS